MARLAFISTAHVHTGVFIDAILARKDTLRIARGRETRLTYMIAY